MSGKSEPSAAEPSPPSRRRWLQFSLRTFLLITTVVAATVGWISTRRDWIQRRHAALAELDAWSGIVVTDECVINDPTSAASSPWSLRLFGETQGIAKIRLEPTAIGWPAAIAEQKRLAALFPEAQVWIAPRNPGDPDPLDDNPQLVAEWAAELKLKAIVFALRRVSREPELTNLTLPVKRAAALQECLRTIADRGARGGAAGEQRRCLDRQSAAAAARSPAIVPGRYRTGWQPRGARREIYRRHMATLADWQKAVRAGCLPAANRDQGCRARSNGSSVPYRARRRAGRRSSDRSVVETVLQSLGPDLRKNRCPLHGRGQGG